jgi:hypothetical protein
VISEQFVTFNGYLLALQIINRFCTDCGLFWQVGGSTSYAERVSFNSSLVRHFIEDHSDLVKKFMDEWCMLGTIILFSEDDIKNVVAIGRQFQERWIIIKENIEGGKSNDNNNQQKIKH